jgi:hypothetical protein
VDKRSANKPWNWQLYPTYHIGILDFEFRSVNDIPADLHDNWMLGLNLWFDGNVSIPTFETPIGAPKLLNLTMISLPNFRTSVTSAHQDLEKFVWLFARLGSMSMSNHPSWCNDVPFVNALSQMELGKLTAHESTAYQSSLDAKKDQLDALMTAKAEGIAEGIAEGMAKGMAQGQEKTLVNALKGLVAQFGVEQGKALFKKVFSSHSQDILDKVIGLVEGGQPR